MEEKNKIQEVSKRRNFLFWINCSFKTAVQLVHFLNTKWSIRRKKKCEVTQVCSRRTKPVAQPGEYRFQSSTSTNINKKKTPCRWLSNRSTFDT